MLQGTQEQEIGTIIIQQHKEVEIVWYGSRSYVDKKLWRSVFRNVFQIVDANMPSK